METARLVASHVSEGRSVRLVGGAGSGRSVTLRQVARLLEARGVEVLRTSDVARPPQLPGFALASLQLGSKEDRRSSMDLAVSARRVLLESPGTVLLIDNADVMDAVSLEVLDSVCPPLVSVRVVRTGDGRSKPVWPEVVVVMPELGFEEVAELVRDRLGGGDPSASVTARVLSKSGGNPELVIAIVESALMSGLLRREDQLWRLAGQSLWSEQLVPLVRWRIRDVGAEALGLLRSLSVRGPVPLTGELFAGCEEAAGVLLGRGVVRVVDVTPAERLVHVWPPLIADLFTHQPGFIGAQQTGDAATRRTPGPTNSAGGSTPSATARVFQLAADRDADALFRQWQQTPTTAAAIAFIACASSGSADHAHAREVFAATSHSEATRDELFHFHYQHAQWLAFEHNDLDAALALLKRIGNDDSAERPRSHAGALLLRAFLDEMPHEFAEQLAAYPGQDRSGFVGTVLASLHFFAGDVPRAQAALRTVSTQSELSSRILSSLVDTYAGDLRGANATALALRNDALLATDRSAFVGASYVSTVSTLLAGRLPQIEDVVGSALGLAPVTLLARPFFGSLLNIAAGVSWITRHDSTAAQSLALEVRDYAPAAGPLYGMGFDLSPTSVMTSGDRHTFGRRVVEGVRLRRSRGYLTAAWTTAVCAAAIDASREIYTEIAELSRMSDVPLFTHAARTIDALLHDRIDDVQVLIDSGAIDQDAQLIAQIVRASQHQATSSNRTDVAGRLEPIARQLETLSTYPIDAMVERFDSGERLSPREREIALLAGGMTNAQIAMRLNISVRTVEHHISNGLHKIGRQSRVELSAVASEYDD